MSSLSIVVLCFFFFLSIGFRHRDRFKSTGLPPVLKTKQKLYPSLEMSPSFLSIRMFKQCFMLNVKRGCGSERACSVTGREPVIS